MEYFLGKYPRVGEWVIVMLLGILGWFMVHTLTTSVNTQEKIATAIEVVSKEVQENKIKIVEHEVRLKVCENVE